MSKSYRLKQTDIEKDEKIGKYREQDIKEIEIGIEIGIERDRDRDRKGQRQGKIENKIGIERDRDRDRKGKIENLIEGHRMKKGKYSKRIRNKQKEMGRIYAKGDRKG